MVQSRSRTAGFSMIELVVAMAITLVISGAMYGLIAAGQGSFAREPELVDRQQNIRVAMSLIQQDIAKAGMQLPDRWQSFSRTETNGTTLLDGEGPGSPRLVYQANGTTIATNSDFLQVFGNDGQCGGLDVCKTGGASIQTRQLIPGCFGLPGLVVLTDTTGIGQLVWGCQPGAGGASACTGGGTAVNGHMNFPHGQASGVNPPGGPNLNLPATASAAQVVRYEIRLDAVEKDRNGNFIPSLWRSADAGGIFNDADSGGKCAAGGGGAGWQLVARWIEDLQVQYRTNNGWFDSPPAAGATAYTLASYNDIVREVRFTLSARANLLGTSPGAGGAGGSAAREQITSTVSPRAALEALTRAVNATGSPVPQWR